MLLRTGLCSHCRHSFTQLLYEKKFVERRLSKHIQRQELLPEVLLTNHINVFLSMQIILKLFVYTKCVEITTIMLVQDSNYACQTTLKKQRHHALLIHKFISLHQNILNSLTIFSRRYTTHIWLKSNKISADTTRFFLLVVFM